MEQVLDGIRVFDASAGIAGPYTGHLLALAGADVIKVEPPQGEWGRIIGRKADGHGLPFLAFNGAKRSLAVDLKQPEGAALARDVALQCDVVIENFRPGVMDRLGLGAAALRAVRPDQVYVSISGFGTTGPNAARPALDTIIQAQAGWLDMSRDGDGNPILMEYAPIDVLTALYATQATMAALIGRFRFGQGRHVEISLLEAAIAFLAPRLMEAAMLPPAAGASAGVPTGIYPASDGLVALAIKDDREFRQLAETLGHSEWGNDPRYATRASRELHRAECEADVRGALSSRTAADWDQQMAHAGIVGAKVNRLDEVIQDPHFQAIGGLRWDSHPHLGQIARVQVPGLNKREPGPAPAVGEHSREILSQFGIGAERIDAAIAGRSIFAQE